MGFLGRLIRKVFVRSDSSAKPRWKLPEGWTETKVCDDVYALHMPEGQIEKWKAERHEKDNVDELITKNGFHNCYHGRGGYIYYVEDGHLCEIFYELSDGLPFNIALSSLDLRRWARPEGKSIPQDKQLEILRKLRSWLREQKLRTGIDKPTTPQVDRRCAWRECTERRIKGFAYCPHHYDLNLLRE